MHNRQAGNTHPVMCPPGQPVLGGFPCTLHSDPGRPMLLCKQSQVTPRCYSPQDGTEYQCRVQTLNQEALSLNLMCCHLLTPWHWAIFKFSVPHLPHPSTEDDFTSLTRFLCTLNELIQCLHPASIYSPFTVAIQMINNSLANLGQFCIKSS